LKGLLEIKCVSTKKLVAFHRLGPTEIPKEYLPQLTHQLWCAGDEYQFVDLYIWDDRLPDGLRTVRRRLWRSEANLDAHETAVREFLAEVDAALNDLHTLQKKKERTNGQETE
jgi:hypothetical protein|tara:strand:- start:1927 stop:2265 length:339 start_codon:yes stop_codon:yes gene_type:complete